MEKLQQTVELESVLDGCHQNVSRSLGRWPRRGGWTGCWHLMECRAFYLGDVNLCADQDWMKTHNTCAHKHCVCARAHIHTQTHTTISRLGRHLPHFPFWSQVLFSISLAFCARSVPFWAGRSRWRYCLSLSWHSETRRKFTLLIMNGT